MRKKLLFTLVELIVVTTIISILAAMLLPALKGARDSAKSIACLNNIRQTFMGPFTAWMDGDKDRLSTYYKQSPGVFPDYGDWLKDLELDGTDVPRSGISYFTCPARPVYLGQNGYYSTIGTNCWMTPFAINYYLCDRNVSSDPKTRKWNIKMIKNPAYIITFSEVTDWGTGTKYKGAYGIGNWSYGAAGISVYNQPEGRLGPVHRKNVNCVFLDGHAESLTYLDASSGVNPKYWSPGQSQ